jgi:hypothetical protein
LAQDLDGQGGDLQVLRAGGVESGPDGSDLVLIPELHHRLGDLNLHQTDLDLGRAGHRLADRIMEQPLGRGVAQLADQVRDVGTDLRGRIAEQQLGHGRLVHLGAAPRQLVDSRGADVR